MAKSNSLFLGTSRYVHGGATETANGRIEWWERNVFPRDPSDLTYVVENVYAGNPQGIATIFYAEPRMWWLICQYNNILDPISEIKPGRILLIPTKDRVQLMLTGRQGGKPSLRELIPAVPPVVV